MNVEQANVALAASTETQVLSFLLGTEQYAVEILGVREILGMRPLTPIPHAPPHVCGVMNLRGAVVPVLDMRASLSLPTAPHEPSSVIIVLTVCGRTMGFVVDGVSDVLTLDSAAIERAPVLGGRIDAAKVRGIARAQDRYVILLDIDRRRVPRSRCQVVNVPALSAAEFQSLRKIIRDATGIAMGDRKQDLVAGRLAPRLRALSLGTFGEYVRYLEADKTGAETNELVNRVTTNKSSFFREPHHFDYLRTRMIPELIARASAGGQRRIRIWSAACSNGQEPWSLAMTLADALGSLAGWDIRILASDLDTNVLANAERASYDAIATDDIPPALRAKYLEPAENGESRIIAPLRSFVTFRRMNLVEPASWHIRTKFDAIFCRNVAIYFDRPTQELVFKELAALLEPTGYLMSGHSENLHWLASFLRPVGNTVHVLAGAAPSRVVIAEAPSARSVRRRVSLPPVPSFLPSYSVLPKRPSSGLRRSVFVSAAPVPSAAPGGGKRDVAIQVGGIHASARGAIVRTTLGSCVAACLYDPETGIGGMNHFLLPEDRSGIRGPTNFGVHAMEMLINSIMKLGGDRSRFVAKLFGGADQIASSITVGRKNAEFAMRFLEEEGIPIIGQKIGGMSAMMVVFDTATGKAQVKTLERSQELTSAERSHVASLATQAQTIPDDITFFGS